MISKDLEATLNGALKEAKTRRHEYVSLEHLLFALLRDKDGKSTILACGGDIEKLQRALESNDAGEVEKFLVTAKQRRDAWSSQKVSPSSE